ncbi:MAG: patatin-like phospholipase family protein [Candidatus Omnitrophica bacterium]|nr:patatin-like phospholipase family protein [Candidatus Omnitrophota bacterium]
MVQLDNSNILKDIPLFSGFSDEEFSLIKEKANLIEYKKGQIIYKEGDPADAFYCIVIGRVLIFTQDALGNRRILEYLHRGKYFGIISLLTGEPHSVTSQAINDCLILVIKKEDFDYILKKIPSLAIDLSKTLSRRLKNKDIHQKIIFESTIISIFSSYSQAGKTIYAMNLAFGLKKQTHKSVIILDILSFDKLHTLPHRLGITDYKVFDLFESKDLNLIQNFILKDKSGIDLICFSYKPEEELCIKRLFELISLLVNDYHYIILDLPSLMDRTVFRILSQSDEVHILSSPEPVDLKRTAHLSRRLKTEFGFAKDKIKIIINEYKLAKLTTQQQIELLRHPVFATLPKIGLVSSERLVLEEPECEYSKAIRRISRQIGDCLVGIALGVGCAYGFCHIGVLKVIEEERIPIDVIAGSSMGALIASLWALGMSSKQILEIACEFQDPRRLLSMVDLTLPTLGFIKGKKLYNFLKRYLNNKTFSDVRLPLKIVTSNVKTKESIILDKGLLIDAIMASCAMPGVFMPSRFKPDNILLDGGVVSPLPTEPLFKIGVKKIIAVNVTPTREDILKQHQRIKGIIQTSDSIRKRFSGLKGFFLRRLKNNILDIIFSSIEVMQSEIASQEARLADVVLHPFVSDLHWLEFHKAEEFAKRGEEETRRNLDKIWQIVNE